MTDEPTLHHLSERMARLEGGMKAQEERMNAMNERYDKGWALVREDMAKRDKDNQCWTITLVLGCTALVIGAVALLV